MSCFSFSVSCKLSVLIVSVLSYYGNSVTIRTIRCQVLFVFHHVPTVCFLIFVSSFLFLPLCFLFHFLFLISSVLFLLLFSSGLYNRALISGRKALMMSMCICPCASKAQCIVLVLMHRSLCEIPLCARF